MFFTILDFRNATRMFADPNFNGPEIQSEEYDPEYYKNKQKVFIDADFPKDIDSVANEKKKKVYVNNVEVTLISERVQYYDEDGKLIIFIVTLIDV